MFTHAECLGTLTISVCAGDSSEWGGAIRDLNLAGGRLGRLSFEWREHRRHGCAAIGSIAPPDSHFAANSLPQGPPRR